MTSLQCLKHEWLCQIDKNEKEEAKNNQEDHSSSGKKDPELNTTKHNLSQSKGQWDPSHNYVMFDCETRTMSRADEPCDDEDNKVNESDCEHNKDNEYIEHDDSNKENEDKNDVNENNRISQTSSSSTTHENNSNDCRKRVADGEDSEYLEATIGHRKRSKTPLVEAEDEDTPLHMKINSTIRNAVQTVITFDQVQQKANEIRESKRMSEISIDSFDESCSIVLKSKEDNHFNEVDDLSANADDEQTATDGDPTPTPDISEMSIPCVSGETKTENISIHPFAALAIPKEASVTLNSSADVERQKTFLELPDQTLWQAIEGTITPLWEVANVGETTPLGNYVGLP